ncbi:MAG: carboxypeptidase-like regulatory domain-containing protein [Deltaproteobacteria bacterium]|nr:carboxypeptidase-like regulatory domain-containing protein [Deltaproteobacteria bacterium]
MRLRQRASLKAILWAPPVLCLLAVACHKRPAVTPATPGSVEGKVTATHGVSLHGLKVALRRANTVGGTLSAATTTDASGRFRVAPVAPGQYIIECEIAGRSASVGLVVQPGETLRTVLRLQDPARLTGRVLDRKGNPVPSALVLVWPSGQGTTQAQESVTSEQGTFVFEQLFPGNLSVLVQAAGIGSVKLDPVSVPSRPLVINLDGVGLSIEGSVVGPKGPEPQATVRLGGAGLRSARTTETDTQGRFRFHGLGPGEYALRAGTVVLASSTRAVTVADADVTGEPLRLGPGEVISGNVIDGARKPLGGARVVVQAVPPDDCPEVLTPDVVGYFSTIALPRGQYEVSAAMPGFVAEAPQRITINGRPPALSLALFRAGRVVGRVVLPNGKPAAGAQINVTSPAGSRYPRDRLPVVSGNLPLAAEAAALGTQLLPHVMRTRSVTADAKGTFSLGELRPGSYGLAASLEGAGRVTAKPRLVTEGTATDFGTLTLVPVVSAAPTITPMPTGARTLIGTVKDAKGKKVPNASVAVGLTADPSSEFVSTIANSEGNFVFSSLPDGKALTVRARHPELGSTALPVGGTDKSVALRFLAPGGIEGEVVDARGRFVQDARVSLRSADGTLGPPVQMAGAGFRALGVPSGSWTLVVQIGDAPPAIQMPLEVPPAAQPGVASLRGIRVKLPKP